jgi:hypothetical protein
VIDTVPKSIALTVHEWSIVARIRFNVDPERDNERYLDACEAAIELVASLLERNAIPQVRCDYFVKDEHNVGPRKSRLRIVETWGRNGKKVFRHPDFMRYLRNILLGPNLPASTIGAFCAALNNTSDDSLDALRKLVRKEIRTHKLEPGKAAEEFYLLALETGQHYNARAIRDAAKSTRPIRCR